MDRLALPLVAALLLSAGCLGGSKAPPPPPVAADNATGTFNGTAPDGSEMSAFKETNKTETAGMGAMNHTHDYWGGLSRKVIWEEDLAMAPPPLTPPDAPAGSAAEEADIPAPGLVIEGTSKLEFLVSNVTVGSTGLPAADGTMPAHPHVTIQFNYMTANDNNDAYKPGGQLVPGTPFVLPVAAREDDMPHSTHSMWRFEFFTGETNSVKFHLTVAAIRGYPVVNWPPHPNLYADSATRTIFDGKASAHGNGTAQSLLDGSDVSWLAPERIVSYGTEFLEVNVSEVTFNAQVPLTPDHFLLEYHNASYVPKMGNGDPAGGRLVDAASDGKVWHFKIPVDLDGMDSPYARSSRWEFRFVPRYTDPSDCASAAKPAMGPAYGQAQKLAYGCQWVPFTETYHITIVGHGHSTASGIP